MSTVRLTQELLAEGYSYNELARWTRTGRVRRLRRGAYDTSEPRELNTATLHLRLVRATVRLTAPDAVVSHLSAAVLHGLPVFATQLRRVQLTRSSIPGGKNRGGVHLHAAPLDPSEVVLVDGIRATSVARTVVDLGRTLPFEQAVMAGDAAIRAGLRQELLNACLLRSSGRPGVVAARRMARFADGLSESPGESLSRVALRTAGLPTPTLQHAIHDPRGRLVGRVDFCWEEHRTVGEFDGRVKYGRLAGTESTEEVVYQEKLREDAIRDLGWQVVRWVWSELETPEVIAGRLRRAFARAAR